uniref:Phosphomannomutase n=1 Tax=Lotharella oceanica TaxID=641309 RepID=A0A7S2TUU0_9EUKA|mmetsp:Transcript_28536/g.53492  ORF Transcript_28536/g.53492 Transcript_28536/m.53492 type:complete len:260 (+) Transcript_28536:52-831(+)|eukprot:CAMPEP_0170198202 /NCGR_PEP_ID=MMETSP0040_2-20121228/68196_1 /TAXON_ID=641309 /ORGANISM="Lotharella oceanica, Strain CCMP622" /LENGTH=259 /DNA_ID=CAMNT_0010448081 /DNA_START=51 /DNA_END=830 /DNA_ORIENTATION=+
MATEKKFALSDSRPKKDRIFLFDVDGTLTIARKEIDSEMKAFMEDLRSKAYVGVVGGSDLPKQLEQLGDNCVNEFDYFFTQNGLVSFKKGQPLASTSITEFLGEKKLQKLINFILGYLSKIELPCKRGTFIEYRTGMLNVSPIGRGCSRSERNAFEEYDNKTKVRATMVEVLKKEFADFKLTYSIGGQISFDVFPEGWDKTYCLPFLEKDGFKEIHFFGDKTYQGGNDYEIYTDKRTVGHSVKNPADTRAQVTAALTAE